MQLGKYEILQELGHGGFGTVYKATDTALGRTVALKILHPQLAADADFVERFRKEARLLARLDHPNIVTIYDFGEIEGRYYISMRYLSGGNLAQRIQKSGGLPYAEVLRIMGQLIDGLSYAHGQGLIHRDMKPLNVLFDQNDKAVITDFGLARIAQESSESSSSIGGVGVGTPHYKAPEIWRGEKATPAADQYSLACMLVEMLTGKVLFDADSTPTVMLMHFEPVKLPEKILEEFPTGFQENILRALSQDPQSRFSDITEFQKELSQIKQDHETSSIKVLPNEKEVFAEQDLKETKKKVKLPNKLSKENFSKRFLLDLIHKLSNTKLLHNKWFWIGATSLVIALLIAIGFTIDLPHKVIEADKETLPIIAETGMLGKGTVSNVAYAPDGKTFAVATSIGIYIYNSNPLIEMSFSKLDMDVEHLTFSPDGLLLAIISAGQVNLYDFHEARITLKRIYELESNPWCLDFSPDSTLLAVGTGGRQNAIFIYTISDGSLLHTLEGHTGSITSVEFSPDGTLLVSSSMDGLIYLWDMQEGDVVDKFSDHYPKSVNDVTFSPEGKYLASCSAGDETVRIRSLVDNTYSKVISGLKYVYRVKFSNDGKYLAFSYSSNFPKSNIAVYTFSDGNLNDKSYLWGHTFNINDFDIAPDGSKIISSALDNTVRIWDITGLQEYNSVIKFSSRVYSLASSPSKSIIAAGSHDGADGLVTLWDITKESELFSIDTDLETDALDFSPDGTRVAFADKNTVKVYRAADGTIDYVKDFGNDEILCIQYSPDGTKIALAGKSGAIYLLDANNGEIIKRINQTSTQSGKILSLAFSPDGTLIASGNDDWKENIYLWEVATGKTVRTLDVESEYIFDLEFSPDGEFLYAGSQGEIDVFNITNGRLLYGLDSDTTNSALDLSPDGKILAFAAGSEIYFWNIEEKSFLGIAKGHNSTIYAIEFSSDGMEIATGSFDGTIRLWNVPSEEQIASVESVTSTTSGSNTKDPIEEPSFGSMKVREKDEMEMMYIPAGGFFMGSTIGNDRESPVHTVLLDGYWIDKYEVTNIQYTKCVAKNACDPPNSSESYTQSSYYGNRAYDNYPVIWVSWYDAEKYCSWVGGRLPTEAEWEKAARGTNGSIYPWGYDAPTNQLVNYSLSLGDTAPVGSLLEGASPYGVMDMAGNVWEWVTDRFQSGYYSTQTEWDNPVGPTTGDYRVLRGGSWNNNEGALRVSYRHYNKPDYSDYTVGFRCVASDLP